MTEYVDDTSSLVGPAVFKHIGNGMPTAAVMAVEYLDSETGEYHLYMNYSSDGTLWAKQGMAQRLADWIGEGWEDE